MNYFQLFLVFISAVSRYISVFAFSALVGVPVGITSSAVGYKIYTLTAIIKKRKKRKRTKKSRKREKKPHENTELLAKTSPVIKN